MKKKRVYRSGSDIIEQSTDGAYQVIGRRPVDDGISSEDARERMIARAQEPDKDLKTMNRHQAELVRRRRNGEIFPE